VQPLALQKIALGKHATRWGSTVELTSFVLGAAGFVVEATTDASNALFLISTFGPDLILMDILMPGIDGLELTRQVKAEPAMRHIVVVASTAFAMKGDEARMRAAGCDGCIAKSFDVGSFVEQVRSYTPACSSRQTQLV